MRQAPPLNRSYQPQRPGSRTPEVTRPGQSSAQPAGVPAPAAPAQRTAAPGSGGGSSDITQKLEEARRNGTLASIVGQEEASAWGDKPFTGDYNSLASVFGHGDLDALMNGGKPAGAPETVAPGGGTPSAPGAVAAPSAGAGAPSMVAQAPVANGAGFASSAGGTGRGSTLGTKAPPTSALDAFSALGGGRAY